MEGRQPALTVISVGDPTLPGAHRAYRCPSSGSAPPRYRATALWWHTTLHFISSSTDALMRHSKRPWCPSTPWIPHLIDTVPPRGLGKTSINLVTIFMLNEKSES